MQNGKDNKVISLFGSRKSGASKPVETEALKSSKKNASSKIEASPEASAESFLDIMKKNNENAERMRMERLKANKSVLRSYNIKD